jgi:hypothetical protein
VNKRRSTPTGTSGGMPNASRCQSPTRSKINGGRAPARLVPDPSASRITARGRHKKRTRSNDNGAASNNGLAITKLVNGYPTDLCGRPPAADRDYSAPHPQKPNSQSGSFYLALTREERSVAPAFHRRHPLEVEAGRGGGRASPPLHQKTPKKKGPIRAFLEC